MRVVILPSLLAADFGNLEAAARHAEAAGADQLHLDIMDGHFVPNLSMGPDVVAMARRCVKIPLSVHLMVMHPDRFIRTFVEAGADALFVHLESNCDVAATLAAMRRLGARVGITLNPETPAQAAVPFLRDVDEVLCMTVRPGYGGQRFMPQVLPKIREVRAKANSIGKPNLDVLVDGGINLETAARCAAHGANAFVVGTFLFRSSDMAAEIARLREVATASLKTEQIAPAESDG